MMSESTNDFPTVSSPESPKAMAGYTVVKTLHKQTIHDLLLATKNGKQYIIKKFKAQDYERYLQEIEGLQGMSHPNIIGAEPRIEPLENDQCHYVATQRAAYGDLTDYISANGMFSETASRTIFRTVLEGLKFAAELKPMAVIHPDFHPSNILMDDTRQVKLCGWSKLNLKPHNDKLGDLIFGCAQLLICMRTSYMPFLNKNNPNDCLFKLISPKHIAKFWHHMTKRAAQKKKDFIFTDDFKTLVECIFFKKYSTLDDILKSSWLSGQYFDPQELHHELQAQEHSSREEKQARQRKQNLHKQKQMRMLEESQLSNIASEEYQDDDNMRSSCEESDYFIEDCYQKVIATDDIPKCQNFQQLIKLQDQKPNLVIACLKQYLRKQLQNGGSLALPEEYVLKDYELTYQHNQVYLSLICQLRQAYTEQDEESSISASLTFKFMRDGQANLYLDIQVRNCDLNEFYMRTMVGIFEDNLQKPIFPKANTV